jgi:membrane associated rhomboid family serine protease
MFIPLYDANPLRTIRAPFVTYGLLTFSTIIFVVFQSGLMLQAENASIAGFGVIPSEVLLPIALRDPLTIVPQPLTFVTYLFVHGNWMHLIGNMLFLWVFGDNVEDAMGHWRFLVFYLLCGIGAALAHVAMSASSDIPLVGASGSIAGMVAAYVILHPRVKLWVLLLMRLPIRISALWAIGGWLLFQFANVLWSSDHATAWWAHIGGFATGALLIIIFRRPGVPLFGRAGVAAETRALR